MDAGGSVLSACLPRQSTPHHVREGTCIVTASTDLPPLDGPPPVDASLRGLDLLTVADFSERQLLNVLTLARWFKAAQRAGRPHRFMAGRSLAMIFEKASLRTRCTFEVGMMQLGGHAIDLASEHERLGVRETVPDMARNLERWVDVIMARVHSHDTVTTLAEYANIPVINGLSDLSHPCQAIGDLMTVYEHRGALRGVQLSFVGDGFNVAHSLLFAAGALGLQLCVATPAGYEPQPAVVARARALGKTTGAEITLSHDPRAAVAHADVIYTDAWVSMGQEEEMARRLKVFPPFQVNTELLALAAPDALVMHCLPAHRGQEVTDDVLDGPQSVVFDQAENRLHAQKAILVSLAGVAAEATV